MDPGVAHASFSLTALNVLSFADCGLCASCSLWHMMTSVTPLLGSPHPCHLPYLCLLKMSYKAMPFVSLLTSLPPMCQVHWDSGLPTHSTKLQNKMLTTLAQISLGNCIGRSSEWFSFLQTNYLDGAGDLGSLSVGEENLLTGHPSSPSPQLLREAFCHCPSFLTFGLEASCLNTHSPVAWFLAWLPRLGTALLEVHGCLQKGSLMHALELTNFFTIKSRLHLSFIHVFYETNTLIWIDYWCHSFSAEVVVNELF